MNNSTWDGDSITRDSRLTSSHLTSSKIGNSSLYVVKSIRSEITESVIKNSTISDSLIMESELMSCDVEHSKIQGSYFVASLIQNCDLDACICTKPSTITNIEGTGFNFIGGAFNEHNVPIVHHIDYSPYYVNFYPGKPHLMSIGCTTFPSKEWREKAWAYARIYEYKVEWVNQIFNLLDEWDAKNTN